jgi:hypothetical protein
LKPEKTTGNKKRRKWILNLSPILKLLNEFNNQK